MRTFQDLMKVCGKENASMALFLTHAVLLDEHERVINVNKVSELLDELLDLLQLGEIPESEKDVWKLHKKLMKELGVKNGD